VPRILVVDDNRKIVAVLSDYLVDAGYETAAAYDGESALESAEKQRPDLALVDVMLPAIDGLEVTRTLQAMGIPVILVTALSDEVDKLVGLGLGADDYITKPFSPREVVARVRTVLRRCSRVSGDDESVLAVGDLTVDSERREVRVSGQEIPLTKTEFDILLALSLHPGRVYSRLQLLEAASGDAFDGYERTVDAHIKNIRRKLGDDSKHPRYIRTVIGVGYKMEA
jgi:DNA-binding response OmpR family regulator